MGYIKGYIFKLHSNEYYLAVNKGVTKNKEDAYIYTTDEIEDEREIFCDWDTEDLGVWLPIEVEVIQSRLYEQDEPGLILDENLGYEHLKLPNLAPEDNGVVFYGFDPAKGKANDSCITDIEKLKKDITEKIYKSMGVKKELLKK